MQDQVICEKAGKCRHTTCKHYKKHRVMVVVGLGRPLEHVYCTKDAECDHLDKICRCSRVH
jgi:hypothetical protein